MDTYVAALDTIANGGGTYSTVLGNIQRVEAGSFTYEDYAWAWAVAFGPDYPYCNTETLLPNDDPHHIQEALWKFISKCHNGVSFFGTWIDDGKLYIDHVMLTDRTQAEITARNRGEKAIYNLVTKETVTL